MAISQADTYYIKALDMFDYGLEEAIENLNYALSYDPEHAGANSLMGRLYMEHFQKFQLAEQYFLTAMASDSEDIQTCKSLIWLMIRTKRYNEALRLIKYAYTLIGVLTPDFMRLEALVYELKKEYIKAKTLLTIAIEESYDSDFIEFLEKELKRVESKEKLSCSVSYNVV